MLWARGDHREALECRARPCTNVTTVDDPTSVADLLEAIRVDPTDARARLKLADLYAKAGELSSAVTTYEWVAKFYAEKGYVVKAVAAYKQLRALLKEKAPDLEPRYSYVLPVLAELLGRIGLGDEAAAIREEIAAAELAYAQSEQHTRTTVDRLEAVQIEPPPASESNVAPTSPARPLPPPPQTPVPFLETPRLRLRGHRPADLAASAAMWGDPIVTKYIGGRPFTQEEVWSKLLRYAGLWALLGFGYWVVEERTSGKFVGEVGFADFKRTIVPPIGDLPEVGWVLASHAHGRGFATEAVRAALAWGDRRFNGSRTVCVIDPGNLASIGVARKTGYKAAERRTYMGSPALVSFR
jgi:RimJ/RimL family protein N-acetyltransferase